jgi:hypothetical protein
MAFLTVHAASGDTDLLACYFPHASAGLRCLAFAKLILSITHQVVAVAAGPERAARLVAGDLRVVEYPIDRLNRVFCNSARRWVATPRVVFALTGSVIEAEVEALRQSHCLTVEMEHLRDPGHGVIEGIGEFAAVSSGLSGTALTPSGRA